jgi:hypothetical protein
MANGGAGGVSVVKFKAQIDFNDKAVIRALQEAKKHILWRQGQEVITQAQISKLVPVDTGTLRRSAVVTLEKLPDMKSVFEKAEKGKGQKPVVVDNPKNHTGDVDVAYVSYNTPYAAALHENTRWRPRDWRKTATGKIVKKPAEGESKWIETALALVRHKFPDIAKAILERYFK